MSIVIRYAMKRQAVLWICLCLWAGLSSCDWRSSSPTSAMRRATGWPFEVVVVMDNDAWNGEVGEILREQLESPIPILFQPEPSMRISHTDHAGFDGLLRYVRNILIVSIDAERYTKVGTRSSNDDWARGQNIVRLNAPNSKELTEYLLLNGSSLLDHFNIVERNRWIESLSKYYSGWIDERLKKMFGISLRLPEEMSAYKEGTDFFWVSNDANRGRCDVIVYSFPYTTEKAFTKDYLVAMRDSVVGKNIPGSFPNSYMSTEKRFGLSYEPISNRGEYRGALCGMWRMEGDMMGGPFVSHALLDKTNGRVIVVEGFVYAPESKKANLIRRLEASLFTTRLLTAAQGS